MHHNTELGYKRLSDSEDMYRTSPTDRQGDSSIPPAFNIVTGGIIVILLCFIHIYIFTVQELCESRGGRPGLSVLTSLLVSVDVKKIY